MPEIIYSGPDGRLEGRMNVVENKRSPVAIILHPLPQFGGNMNNPIIFNLYHTFIKNYSNKVPLKRMANSFEIANAVLFLASAASSYITGSTLMVDGGWSAI